MAKLIKFISLNDIVAVMTGHFTSYVIVMPFLFLSGMLFFPLQAIPEDITLEDVKNLSLKYCLNYEYKKSVYHIKQKDMAKDSSYNWVERRMLRESGNKITKLKDYIVRFSYDSEMQVPDLPGKKEIESKHTRPAISLNTGFYNCMQRYKSRLLEQYINDNIFNGQND